MYEFMRFIITSFNPVLYHFYLQLKIFSLQLMQRDTVFCAKGLIVNAVLLTNVSD